MVKYAATLTVTASLGTTKSCVVEGRDDVKLLCTVSSGCCTSTRVWEKVVGTVSLLSNGDSTDSSKYVEDYDNGNTGFNLIIKNVQKSDFGITYQCRYGVTPSNELYLNDTLCPPEIDCWECAGKDYGWSILGDVIGAVIVLIVAIFIIGKLKTVLIVGGLTFIISAVVNLVALLIGYYACHCVDGTDPWLIVLGLGTSGITGVIVLIIAKKKLKQGQKSNQDGDEMKEKDEKSQPLAK